ncbi:MULTISPECIES: outer membrane protein [Helicobacter]|uniref:Putative Outer membrane protein n=1 Tax=Helicobacter heilmannii TaxID=35817 RepID=A0A0K2XXD7_HELHE|nr:MULTISPECIES: outer membrane protein [Helicobacter]CCM12017.1 outer membrane protein 27 [Helicobacter heilmannii ASB1.4]CRF45103.1 outer membrane protein 27 [Helicobacter heilmannii]CRF49539.1 outer membrane protein 27 [Helicobacter heilmannii]CRF51288.1 outer membrane protein 27 [Helicobacter heilmannii]CRI34350.1 putative Outer membrane protein [Helicobacter heilmannii]
MKLSKKFLPLALLACGGGLHAEKSAFFIGGIYEVGGSTFKARISGKKPNSMNRTAITQGVGVRVGYNLLFGEKGYVGLRFYGFYNWGLTNFGKVVWNRNANFGKNTFNLSGYGVGADLLINLFNGEKSNLGVFGGVALGGNTWYAVHGPGGATRFQWMVNVGVRAVIARHSAFEVGVKIPMLATHVQGRVDGGVFNDFSLSLKRDWAFTAAYYFLF